MASAITWLHWRRASGRDAPAYSSPLLVPGVPNTTMGGMPAGALKPGTPAGPAPPSENPSSCCPLVLLPPPLLRSLLLWASGLSCGAGGASTTTGADAAPLLACAASVSGTSGVCGGPTAPLLLPRPWPVPAATCAERDMAAAAVLPTAAAGARTTRCMLCVEPFAAGPVWCRACGGTEGKKQSPWDSQGVCDHATYVRRVLFCRSKRFQPVRTHPAAPAEGLTCCTMSFTIRVGSLRTLPA